MTKQHIPKIRFQGFDDEWEERELGEITQITMGQSPNSENYTSEPNDNILVQGNADIKNGRVYPRVWTTQVTKTAKINDIIFSVRAPVGDIAIADYDVVIGRGVASIKGSKFIFYSLRQLKLRGYWNKLSTGSTFDSINSNDLKSSKIPLPSLPEQESIGQLFHTLDDLISAYKENLENYQNLKTSMLSKMFPKEGRKQPEIRLDGFDGDWESSILKNLASFSKGNGYTKSDLTDNGQEIILYGQLYTDYKIQIFCSNYFVSKINNNAILSVGGEVIVPASGESADDISRASVISNPNIVIGGDLNIIYPNNNILDSVFLALMISNGSQQKELKRRAQGKSVVHLRNNDLKEVKIFLPSLPEQEAIGAFFANLDETISSYKDKIGQLELLKKNLLSQMFI